jgi:hypothetical protein
MLVVLVKWWPRLEVKEDRQWQKRQRYNQAT